MNLSFNCFLYLQSPAILLGSSLGQAVDLFRWGGFGTPDLGSRSRFWRCETQMRICKHPLKMSCKTAVLEWDTHTWYHYQIHHCEVAVRPEPLRKDTIQIPTALWAQVEFLLICMVLALMRIDIHKYVLPFPDENNTTADFHTSEFSSSLFNLLDIVSLSKSGSQRPSCWTQDGGGWTEQQHKMPQPPLSSLPPSARSRLEFLEVLDSTTWLRHFFSFESTHTSCIKDVQQSLTCRTWYCQQLRLTLQGTTLQSEASLLHPGRLLCAITEKQRANSASCYESGKNLAKIPDGMSQFSWEKKN